MLDKYQLEELRPTTCQQLDKVGMQPHSREYLECELNHSRSQRILEMCEGQSIDYPEGIQFSGKP